MNTLKAYVFNIMDWKKKYVYARTCTVTVYTHGVYKRVQGPILEAAMGAGNRVEQSRSRV
jgi:hypothetical protein